tara:strand:- start:453 stop:1349 length:897 start_codon:yes stop_codon:yes gene_type:complete
MMSSPESFHDKWKSFLVESKTNSESLSEIDAVGAIGNALKKFGMGDRPKGRLGGMRRPGPVTKKKQQDTPEDKEETALIVRNTNAVEKTSSEQEFDALMKTPEFTDLKKNDPEGLDKVMNSVSKAKIEPLINSFATSMMTGAYDSVVKILQKLNVRRASAVAPILDRITGFSGSERREQLFSFSTDSLNEQDNSGFNSALERNISMIFALLKSDYQKYIVGSAMMLFWQKVVDENTYNLPEQQLLAARSIAKIQTDWISKNVDLQAMDDNREKNQADLNKAAKDPEVSDLLAGDTQQT